MLIGMGVLYITEEAVLGYTCIIIYLWYYNADKSTVVIVIFLCIRAGKNNNAPKRRHS